MGITDPDHRAEGENPVARFWDILVRTMRTFEIFGLMRTETLKRTLLHENYYGSDKPLLAEMALHGRFRMVERDGRQFFVGENAGITTDDRQHPSFWMRAEETTAIPGDREAPRSSPAASRPAAARES